MKKKDDDSGDVEPEDTPKKKKSKSKKQRSSAKKFARTIKGSFRGFTSLMTRTGKTPNKSSSKLSSTPEESTIASRTRARRNNTNKGPR